MLFAEKVVVLAHPRLRGRQRRDGLLPRPLQVAGDQGTRQQSHHCPVPVNNKSVFLLMKILFIFNIFAKNVSKFLKNFFNSDDTTAA
jgi:hypothetical protein